MKDSTFLMLFLAAALGFFSITTAIALADFENAADDNAAKSVKTAENKDFKKPAEREKTGGEQYIKSDARPVLPDKVISYKEYASRFREQGRMTVQFGQRISSALPPPDYPGLPPQLVKICFAESGLRQFDDDGRVLLGRVNPHDIGICQINTDRWESIARSHGYDIFTESGNIAMANWLYTNCGTEPWNNSRHIWSRY